MHRHGYKGRKFGREKNPRNAMLRALVISLFEHHSITTTTAKAKEIRPIAEKLITKAKKGDLHNTRQIIKKLHSVSVTHHLIMEIAPQLEGRQSGFLRIKKVNDGRKGDNAPLSRISFVDDLNAAPVARAAEVEAPKKSTKPAKTAEAKPAKAEKKAEKPAKSEEKTLEKAAKKESK